MHHYRQVVVRLSQGDSDRDIAHSRLMGRPKVAAFRALALAQGWLDSAAVLPDDAAIAAAVGRARRARTTISSVEPYRSVVERWLADGVSGVVIQAVLCREHGYRGSYSSVHLMVAALMRSRPPEATVRRDFAPGETAQVDFGGGVTCLIAPTCFSARRPCLAIRHESTNDAARMGVNFAMLRNRGIAANETGGILRKSERLHIFAGPNLPMKGLCHFERGSALGTGITRTATHAMVAP